MSEHSGKKKRKALKRAQRVAARVYRTQPDVTEHLVPRAGSTEPVAVAHFLQAYGELTDATAELYKRLAPGDPRRQQVRAALAHAQQVATTTLGESATVADTDADNETDADVETEADAEFNDAGVLAANGSVELVRIAPDARPAPDTRPAPEAQPISDIRTGLDRAAAPEPPEPPANLPANLPAVVARRPPKRWLPDESLLVRYVRLRRATHRWPDEATLTRYLRERQLPDESALHRFIRKRRELDQLYGAGDPR
jgi:hypothetical protein